MTRNLVAGSMTVALIVTVLMFIGTGAAAQQTETITLVVPEDTVILRGEPGSFHQVGPVIAVPAHLQGLECQAAGESINPESVHPGNNLWVRSNGSTIVFEDVERAGGFVGTASGLLTLGPELYAEVELGDGDPGRFQTFSGGLVVTVTCQTAQPTTTTSEGTTTSTTQPTTTTSKPSSTTTVSPSSPTTSSSTSSSTTSTTTTEPPPTTTTSAPSTTLPPPPTSPTSTATPPSGECRTDPELGPYIDTNGDGQWTQGEPTSLPCTGISNVEVGYAALALLIGGAGVLVATKRSMG